MAGNTLPEKVSQIYYTYGLFCSSYPAVAIILSLSVVLLCCFPLLNVPLPGNIPTVVNLPLSVKNEHNIANDCGVNNCRSKGYPFQMEVLHNETQKLPYVWVKDKPMLYIHQIIMRIGVSPWNSSLKMWDAFRAPLQEVFRLLETVRNHQDPNLKRTLLQYCYQIENIKRGSSKASAEHVLPEYSCLLLSPANLWQQNLQSFSLDANIVNTVYNYQNLQKGKASIAEMAFGMYLRDTGIKRYPVRSRPRVLQYAITIFYERANERFINSLSDKLREMYPLYQDSPQFNPGEVSLIYYPGKFNYRELVPLIITFIGLFLYVYFYVRKIEFIKSKFGLAASSVVTIAGSLSMSMGICFYFGFSLSLQGKEIFPYLVIIVGLENILVLTKSVTSTDTRLDVKIRLAQGLSKEGWSITKNLLTEITILTLGFFTFVPLIQEFSIFMIVSLMSDYFIQMLFFATILGIDVRRMEFYPEQNNKLYLNEYFNGNSALNWRLNKGYIEDYSLSPRRMTKSRSHPRLNGLTHNSPTNVVAKRNSSPGNQDNKVPKRIRLVNLWARTRFFQRAFMVWMLVWISMIVYNSGIVEYFMNIDKMDGSSDNKKGCEVKEKSQSDYTVDNSTSQNPFLFNSLDEDPEKTAVNTNETIFLKYSPHYRPWSRLTPYHWSTILAQYNESLAGRYVVILPAVLLSHRVSPELAAGLRHPEEKEPPPLRWQALAAALDPIDILPDFDVSDRKTRSYQWHKSTEVPIYPTTPMEILLLAILCTISIAVIAYMMVVLYRCICSRHYAEWRASWTEDEEYKKIMAKQPAIQLVMEAVPIIVEGHSQEVECLVTDGEKIVSSCLQGHIKVWEPLNGEMITDLNRRGYFKSQNELFEKYNQKLNSAEDKTITPVTISNSSNMMEDTTKMEMPRLRKALSSHLKGIKMRNNNCYQDAIAYLSQVETAKYDYARIYRDLYCLEQEYKHGTKENTNNNKLKTNTQDLNYNGVNGNDQNFFVMKSILNKENGLRNRYENSHSDRNKSDVNGGSVLNWRSKAIQESPIWCLDYYNDLIILGCRDGRLEFWEASSGKLMGMWWFPPRRTSEIGVTHVKILSGARRVCAASLTGHITLLRLDVYNIQSGAHVDWKFSTAHRSHKRTSSVDLLRSVDVNEYVSRNYMRFSNDTENSDNEEVVCLRIAYCRPHQQPITELHSEGGRILTGGQDHILKVFSSSELNPLYTLHGHCGAITSCFIDHATPTIAGSGSQDGLLCVWDLHTGACLYSMQAHDGAVTALTYTASYVVSAGSDERLCIWDRFQGHMLNSIHIGFSYMSRMLPLTHTMLVMGDRSGLTIYDLSSGEVIRRVLFGQSNGCIFVRHILPLKDAIVCDYARQLRIVRFPVISNSEAKND